MAATIAVFQAMLKQQLEPKIQDQINWQDVLLEDALNLEGANKPGVEVDLKNNKFTITSLTGGMTAYAGAERGALVNSDIGLGSMDLVPKFTTASYVLGHASIQATMKDQASLERGVDLYGMECRRAMLRAKGRFLRGDGTGIVGILPAGVVTGTTVTVSAKAAGTIVSGAKYGLGVLQVFQPGASIEMGTEADFAAGTTVKAVIDTIISDTQFTLTASKTFGYAADTNNRGGTNATTWYIRFSGEYGNAPMGLLGLVDDGTLAPKALDSGKIQNVTRATTPYMKSVIADKATASTIIKDFRDLYSSVRKFNQNVKYFVVSEDVYAKYTDSITITAQSNPGNAQYQSKLGTGHTGLMFAYGSTPIPIILDTLLPYGTVLLLDSDQMFCGDLFQDNYVDGGVLAKVSGTTDYETIRAAYYNFGTYGSRKLGGQINYQSV